MKAQCLVIYPPDKGGLKIMHLNNPPGIPHKYHGKPAYLFKVNAENGQLVPYEPLSELPTMTPEKLWRVKRNDPIVALLKWTSGLVEKIALGMICVMVAVGVMAIFFIISELGKR